MNTKIRSVLFACLGLLFGMLVMSAYNFVTEKFQKTEPLQNSKSALERGSHENLQNIDLLTAENAVIAYVKKQGRLPDFYITKSEARKLGWKPETGNLCDVLPGRAIGGDIFGNRERKLPTGKRYFEADLNYHCGNRGKDRLVYSETGEVYLTKDHYRTFQKQ